jgi:hypothetical protein
MKRCMRFVELQPVGVVGLYLVVLGEINRLLPPLPCGVELPSFGKCRGERRKSSVVEIHTRQLLTRRGKVAFSFRSRAIPQGQRLEDRWRHSVRLTFVFQVGGTGGLKTSSQLEASNIRSRSTSS